MQTLALHHGQITIPVGEERAARDFYCGVLGLRELEKPEALARRGGFWLALGGAQVHVGTEDGFDRRSTKGHLAYRVLGLAAYRQRLAEAGLEPLDGIPLPGMDRFEFRDPFGNRVELLEIRTDPTELEGGSVRLVPLELDHAPALARFAFDERVTRFLGAGFEDLAGLTAYVERALVDRAEGTALPFAVLEPGSNEVLGTTRFGAWSREHRRAEIGWTFLAPRVWGTGRNAEAKLLLLRHGFETLGLRRVELKTDARNGRSRAAILAIGATFEGVFRSHLELPEGGRRDTAWYGILSEEWPTLEPRLRARLRAQAEGSQGAGGDPSP